MTPGELGKSDRGPGKPPVAAPQAVSLCTYCGAPVTAGEPPNGCQGYVPPFEKDRKPCPILAMYA